MAAASVLVACPAAAQSAAPAQAACAATASRAAGLKFVPLSESLSELSISVAGSQDRLKLAHAALLQGPCASDAAATRMSLVLFKDGTVFAAHANDRFSHSPNLTGQKLGIHPAGDPHPALPQGRFIMASQVDKARTAAGEHALDVGVWQANGAYVVAAYTQHAGVFSAPVELLRSTQPIRSVTYFPSPDSNSGTLGLLADRGDSLASINLDWNHEALSRTLRAQK
ncbi:hypothetical protein DPH57_17180 [Massilia sp. YMA4]|nr:hypothetical protein DPH57_17180 [Massilia sp. YMA4]